jgi:hypothetical protein
LGKFCLFCGLIRFVALLYLILVLFGVFDFNLEKQKRIRKEKLFGHGKKRNRTGAGD